MFANGLSIKKALAQPKQSKPRVRSKWRCSTTSGSESRTAPPADGSTGACSSHSVTPDLERAYDEWEDFAIAQQRATCTSPSSPPRRTRSTFWREGTEAGYPSDGGPGPRPVYHEGYYGAFLLDPDGTKVEAVCHNRP